MALSFSRYGSLFNLADDRVVTQEFLIAVVTGGNQKSRLWASGQMGSEAEKPRSGEPWIRCRHTADAHRRVTDRGRGTVLSHCDCAHRLISQLANW